MDESIPELTPIQVRILAAQASGKTQKQIAEEFYMTLGHVSNTTSEARKRLGAKTLAAAVMRAHRLGYLSSPTGPDLTVFPNEPQPYPTR